MNVQSRTGHAPGVAAPSEPARLETPHRARPPGAATTLAELLRRNAALPAAATCGLRFVDRHEHETLVAWREVAARAERVAARLVAAGVLSGDRVGLVYPTCPEFFDAFFGVLLCGAVPAPLYPPIRLGRMPEYEARTAAMLRAADARLLLADARVRRLLGGVLHAYQPPLGCLTPAELDLRAPSGHAAAAGPPRGACAECNRGEHALALVQFSSGTTAAPKPVALSHRALLEQAHLLHDHFPDAQGERPQSGVSWLPLYHDMGLVGCVLPALLRPATLTLLPPELFLARPALWLRALSRHHATVSPAPNFAYALATERATDDELRDVDLSSWRVALNGAEAVSPEVLRAFVRRFSRYGFRAEALTPVYGLAEAALAVTFSALGRGFRTTLFEREALAQDVATPLRDDPASAAIELVSVGRPVPGFAVEIRGEDSAVLEEGRVGRVNVRGPSLLNEYLGQPEETARVLKDGWLDTGDLGFVHRGELYLAGRAKDVLVVAGRKHPPEPLERAAGDVAGVRTGCVVAVTQLASGAEREELWLLAEVRRGHPSGAAARTTLEDGVRRAVATATGLRADHVWLLRPGTLPRTSSGKLRRAEARRLLLRGELAPLRLGAAGSALARKLAAQPAVQAAAALLRSQRLDRKRPRSGT